MKRISLTLSILFLFSVLVQSSFAIGQGAEILRTNGSYILSQTDLDTYYAVSVFVLDRSLSLDEQTQIKQIIYAGFDENPKAIRQEIVSLSWALSEIAQINESTKVDEIRLRFRQQMIDKQAKGEKNPLVRLLLSNI